MKILILSDACFNDNIIPMYKAMLNKGLDVTCLINLTSLKIMLFDIDKRLPKQSIIKATEYIELKKYERYVDMSNIYLVNHEVDKKHFWRDLTSTLAIINFISKGKFDVIHCDFPLRRSKMLLYLFRNKFVWIQHDPFPHLGHTYSHEYKFALKVAHRLMPKFVILNSFDYDRYCKEFHINSSRVFINKLGPLDCINLFASPTVKERGDNVLFFGRIAKYKGVEYLCEAMKRVHEIIPTSTITIAGSGKFYFDIEPYKKLPYFEIHNRFIEEEELARFIQESSVTICAYVDASQSGGVLTSFAMGKPVIASNLETMREIVLDGHNGILVPPGDSVALADAIVRALNDDFRKELKNNIIEDSTNGVLSWNSIVDKYIEIYHK